MKILSLRLKNLNALYGEWAIDFTDPEYLTNGIFALTGPTGAGKSTILDAICLALYGATPRLGRITQSTNEIMSRQTGECYAEVVFESQAGKFLCHWEQRRSRKKPDGALQAPEHQIANAANGKILETKKSLVLGVIEAKTGMDFDRFTRSILLAQGGFDTFLKANAEEKSKILEQITGTAIYSDISRRVHERQRDEKEQLNLLEAETSAIDLLTPEAIEAIEGEVNHHTQTEVALVSEAQKTQEAINWLKTLSSLQQEFDESSQALVACTHALAAFTPERNTLDKAILAATLSPSYAEVQTASKQIKADEAEQQHALTQLPLLSQATAQQSAAFKATALIVTQAKAAITQAAPVIQQVRSLDQTIIDQEKALSQAGTILAAVKSDIQKKVDEKQSIQLQRDAADSRMLQATDYLQSNSQDAALVSSLSGIEAQLTQLATQQKAIEDNQQLLSNAEIAYETAKLRREKAETNTLDSKQALQAATDQHAEASATLATVLNCKLLREYRTEKDTRLREMALNAKIAELEDHRNLLEDGKPCPLCGAEEHPFASGNLPKQDETEAAITALNVLIEQAEAQAEKLSIAEKSVHTAQQRLIQSENEAANIANEITSFEKTISVAKQTAEQLDATLATDSAALSATLAPLGVTNIASTSAAEVLASLSARLEQWQKQTKAKEAITIEVVNLDTSLTRLNTMIESAEKSLLENKAAHTAVEENYLATKMQRQSRYGDKNPDSEEQRLNNDLLAAEEKEREVRLLMEAAIQKEQATQTQIELVKKRIADAKAPFEALKNDFIATMQATGFAEQQDFRDARMDPNDQAALAAKAKALDDQHTELSAKHKDRETRLITEKQRAVTNETLTILEPAYQTLAETLSALQETIAGLKQQLMNNKTAMASIQDKQATISARKKECARWDKLHALIGSADGKKFRNFAQGLTFELMVSHANHQLEKMTDRYLLMRDTTLPLALNVVDNYQAGEIRSTKNLSGGESFIVSLTLALGLSKMASRKVRIDSLFLDEGFGTLDEDALETALETLSGLHQEGKLIGIISHVGALKERIQTQISVTPLSAGKSALSGPGCTKVT